MSCDNLNTLFEGHKNDPTGKPSIYSINCNNTDLPNICISYITKFINTTESFLFFGANVQNFLHSLRCYIVGAVLLHYNVPVRRFITWLYIQKDTNLRVTVTNEIHELWSPTNRQWWFHSNLTNKPNIYIHHMFSFIFGGYLFKYLCDDITMDYNAILLKWHY